MKKNHPILVEGSRVQDLDTGEIYRVGRVTPSSATLTEEYQRPKMVTIGDRTFEAMSGGKSIQVSPHSMMRRLT